MNDRTTARGTSSRAPHRRAVLRALALAPVLLGSGAALAACSEEPEQIADVSVSGLPGERPTLTYTTPLTVTSTTREQVWAGSGDVLAEGDVVLLDYLLEDGTDASVVADTWAGTPQARTLTAADLGADLVETLVGQRVGARMLQVGVAQGTGGGADPTVAVVDVLPTRAEGTDVAEPDGLPVVTRAEDGTPSLTAVDADPGEQLQVAPLLRGAGVQVAADDAVTVQYTAWTWAGTQVDTTWDTGVPVSFALEDVPAWSEGLVEQTVGSQVLLVVPPSYALGATATGSQYEGRTIVFVVDVLAARPVGGLPYASATATASAAATSAPPASTAPSSTATSGSDG